MDSLPHPHFHHRSHIIRKAANIENLINQFMVDRARNRLGSLNLDGETFGDLGIEVFDHVI